MGSSSSVRIILLIVTCVLYPVVDARELYTPQQRHHFLQEIVPITQPSPDANEANKHPTSTEDSTSADDFYPRQDLPLSSDEFDGGSVEIESHGKKLLPRTQKVIQQQILPSSSSSSSRQKCDCATQPPVHVIGMSFEYESDKKRVEYDDSSSPHILEGTPLKIRLYGRFDDTTFFKVSKFHKCDDPSNREMPVKVTNIAPTGTSAIVHITLPRYGELDEIFICLNSSSSPSFVRQGEIVLDGETAMPEPWLVIKLYKAMLPLWLHFLLLSTLLALSGLFSGLNLGLMSLNKTDLKIIINTGTLDERSYAAAIAPVRNHGNFLLCCLLFSNVLVNASLTILVDDLTSGLIAIMMSTLAIVIFGEIIPQAICSRHGLAVGAKTIYVTKFFMCITCPLAYPLSKILDRILGEEIGSVYTRERLKELLRVTKDHHGLAIEEVGIISGALDMKTKTVKDIMVRLESVFMLPIDAVLDFETFAFIEYQGYSRIPVYQEDRSNIVGLLNVKQLTLLDANDNIPLKTVIEYYQNQLFFVFENARLDYMFRTFREGNKGHMAFVQQINDEGEGDPFYQTIGLVTFEDVLEELLQAEIMDESDIGKQEARLAPNNKREPIKPFDSKRKPKVRVEIPAPLALAAVQFLSTSVEPFKKEWLSVAILQRLVRGCAQYIKMPKDKGNQHLPEMYLYESGKPSEYFVMVLEGRVEVTVGKENLTYESGAFTTFGKDFFISELAQEQSGATSPTPTSERGDSSCSSSLFKPKRRTFIPDYTVRVATDLHYLMMKFSAYKAAMLATVIERSNADPSKIQNKNWRDEIDKVLERGAAGEEDNTSESSRRPRMSRDESFKTYKFGTDTEPASRKTSLVAIGENNGGIHSGTGASSCNRLSTIPASSNETNHNGRAHGEDAEETSKLL
ncbi:metal transporter CNNM4 [Folsomia candida]|uniref:Metal transporter CNNM2 n=1 Tax=Folsomia candida TaxID=158441 RepID=A0A226F348_FOLCA|nr:metal transporter CNNM4 [Folsomia candida]OXA64215.1 Metal transporter CNNM2 [Folsomia candida]